MRYEDFSRHLAAAGFTVQEFARAMKMHKNSITNYSVGDSVPGHLGVIAVLLAELRAKGVDPKSLAEKFEIQRKKPRGRGKGTFGGDRQIIMFKPDEETDRGSSVNSAGS